MFELINRRASIGVRSGLIAACALPPIALLLYLFVTQVSQGIHFTAREIQGASYISEVWPALVAADGSPQAAAQFARPMAEDPRTAAFDVLADAKAFDAAGHDTKLNAGVVLIRAVGDGSGLTLDSALSSYYAMDAVTVKLPRLLAAVVAVSRSRGPVDRAFAMGEVVNFADATAYNMRQAISHDPEGHARAALAGRAADLASAVKDLRGQSGNDAAQSARVLRSIDDAWKADYVELIRLLSEREAGLKTHLAVNLSLVTVSLGFAVLLMIATARGVTGRLRGLLHTMDHLNVGDTHVDIPYLSDSNETGRIAATLGAFKQGLIDAVERHKQVEEGNAALRLSEARYRLLADNSTDVIMRYDAQGQILYVSPSIARYGYRPEDIVGSQLGLLHHPNYRDRAHQRFADTLGGKPDHLEDWQARTADGRWVWMEGRLAPLLGDEGAIIGVLETLRDAQTRREAEEALREVNAELMRVARASALGALATSIAHEINQPLAAVVINSEAAMRWLSNTPSNVDMAAEAIGRCARDARRASEVVNRMRSMVTRQEAKHADFELNEAIAEVLTLTQGERKALDVESHLLLIDGQAIIHGDRIQFQQVLLNLIINAIDAMREVPADERRLTISSHDMKGGDLQVAVEDCGVGVDQEAADRIFQHLFSTKVGGTGLGLAISQSIIEAHGGRIWVEPATPRGAIFKFNIPAARRGAA